MRSGKLLQLAARFPGECFTRAFDRSTFHLPPEAKRKRRLSRVMKVIDLELSRDVNLKKPWRRGVCIRNKKTYGGLLGKNAAAMLTVVVGPGRYKKEDGCLPGPGAKSGLAFVFGGTLGIRGDSFTAGVLAREYDETAEAYRELHGKWKELAQAYKANAGAATVPEEQLLWNALHRQLLAWASADHFRKQFRLCEFSKIGDVVCRNQGIWRQHGVDEFPADDPEILLEQEAVEEDLVDVDEANFLARIDEVLASETRGRF